MSLKSHLIVLTDQCNDDFAHDIVSQTKPQMFNLPQINRGLPFQLFACWVIFHEFCLLLIFLKINFFEKLFRNTIRVSNSLGPDPAGHFVGPDLGPNCLQRLSADDNSRQIVHDIHRPPDKSA